MARLSLRDTMQKYQEELTEPLMSDALIITVEDEHEGQMLAAAAVLGHNRGKFYLDTARTLINQVGQHAGEISFRMTALEQVMSELQSGNPQVSPDELKVAATHEPAAHALSIHSEVLWHLYAICLEHAWHFLANAAEVLGDKPSLKAEQEREMLIIRAFRNHMEHRDKAVLNQNSIDWESMSAQEEHAFVVGYKRDSGNNISFVPTRGPLHGQEVAMPMNPSGFNRFNDIIIYVPQYIRAQALALLWNHFQKHPNSVPDEHAIGKSFQEGIEEIGDYTPG